MRNFANYDVDIHGKSSGVLKTICKKCLPTRKNKRDRSLRVNVDTGHCHCYHCGADFYVPDDVEERKNAERVAARKRRAAAIPQHFQRPVFDASKTTLSEDTERWLVETRCIPQSVIAALRITEQEEFMPQSGKKERCICFNYFEGEQLINTKFRALPKLFKMVQGAELIPYNIDSILGQTSCIIHEGGTGCCFFHRRRIQKRHLRAGRSQFEPLLDRPFYGDALRGSGRNHHCR